MKRKDLCGLLAVAAVAWVICDITGASPANFIIIKEFSKTADFSLMPFADVMEIVSGGNTANIARNIGGNIALSMPLGFLLPLFWAEFRKLYRVVAFGGAVSVFIEVCQLFNHRATVLDDVVLNVLGTLLGALVAFGVLRLCAVREQRTALGRAWLWPAGGWLLAWAAQTVLEAMQYLALS